MDDLGVPDHGALGDQALADVRGLGQGADEVLGAGWIPEPDAGPGVGGGMRWFHRREDFPEHFHLARDRQRGVLRSAPAQLYPSDFMSPKLLAQYLSPLSVPGAMR